MGTFWFLVWSILIINVQASDLMSADEPACSPGFESNEIIFKVTRKQLRLGTRLGKVNFTNCARFLFTSDDHFMVQTDGTVVVRRQVVLYEGHRNFFIHLWDSQSQERTVPVRLLLHGNGHGNQNPQNQPTKPDFENNTEMSSQHFHRSSKGLRRRRRSLLVFPINVAENHRGPFPLLLAQIHSTENKVKKFQYSITGPGTDQPPVGLFTIDRDTGNLYLTQSLDRETQDKYTFQALPVEEGSTSAEEAIEIIVYVIDQNDNKPVFNEDIYVGEVAESSPKGSEVLKIEATDLDAPESYNSDIRYRIVNQEPEEPSPSMFTINPETGVITVNAEGFDRKNYPQYTLQVVAADMQGEGLTGSATVNLTVTEPIITTADEGLKRSRRAVQPDVEKISIPWVESGPRFPGNFNRYFRSTEGLIRRKRGWVIPAMNVSENQRGSYPLKIAQVRSDKDTLSKVYYSITGPGADQSPVNLFTMDRNTGNLYVTQVLDREKQSQYLLRAHAVTEGSSNAERPMDIVINVIDQNDNKPVFTQSIFKGKVHESSPKGFEVMKIEAFDADEPNNDNSEIGYSILSQVPEFPSRSMFTINPITGVIIVNDEGLLKEKYPQYTLTVQAADLKGEGLSTTTTVVLTVTDGCKAPATSPYISGSKIIFVHPQISVMENNRGPFPMKLAHFNPVEDSTKKILYSVTGPGADQHPVGLFTMDRDTGILYITQSLDRETRDKYKVQAHAVAEADGNIAECTDVVVKVIDQNDNKPVFNKDTYLGEVAEASRKGVEVIQVEASDADEPNTDNSDIRYRITSQAPPEPDPFMFVINPITGVITVNSDGLNKEKHSLYTLVVEAADMSGEGLSSQTRVVLSVTAYSQPSSGGGQSRTRRDIQPDAIRKPITWRGRLPRAARNSPHYLKLREQMRTKRRTISNLLLLENHEGPYPLLLCKWDCEKKCQVNITDQDDDRPPVGLFIVDKNALYVTRPLDRETEDHYWVFLKEEGSGRSLSFQIIVWDINDNKPVFSQNTFLGCVAEDSPKGFEVIKVVATDADEEYSDHAALRYRIRSQEPQEPSPSMFEINPETGVIRVNADGLNRKNHPQYTLVVEAADMFGEGFSTQAEVVLTVTALISECTTLQNETQSTTLLPTPVFDPQQKLPVDHTLEQSTASDSNKTPKHKDITSDPSDRLTTDKKTGLNEAKSPKDSVFLLKNSKYKALMLMFYPQLLTH